MMDEALRRFEAMGAVIDPAARDSRRLILPSADGRFEFLPVKSGDVPVYVEAGVADAGVAGMDVLEEAQPDVLRPLDLGFGGCGLAVAAPEGAPYPRLAGGGIPRVATKYVESARRFFADAGGAGGADPHLGLGGAGAAAGALGLDRGPGADRAHAGRERAGGGGRRRPPSTARLIVNRASHKLRLEEHQRLIADLAAALEAGGAGRGRSAGSRLRRTPRRAPQAAEVGSYSPAVVGVAVSSA
jgi:ATP phosphoribosyltransferase